MHAQRFPRRPGRLRRRLVGVWEGSACALVGGVLGGSACALVATRPVAAEGVALGDFQGVWVRAQREADDAARDAAVHAATANISRLLRGLARSAMRRSVVPPERSAITVAGRVVSIERGDAARSLRFDLDAPDSGDPEAPVHRFEGGQLVRSWRRDAHTSGSTTWRLVSRDVLEVHRVIDDPRFGTLAFTTTYGRETQRATDRILSASEEPARP